MMGGKKGYARLETLTALAKEIVADYPNKPEAALNEARAMLRVLQDGTWVRLTREGSDRLQAEVGKLIMGGVA